MRVLIVDDSAVMRQALAKIVSEKLNLTVAGFATNGAEGVEAYKTLLPELVLLDIQMPVMQGDEALVKIREFDPHARVIMISSMSEATMVMKCMKNGAKTFIKKPDNINDPAVLETIRLEINLAMEIDD